MDKLLGKENSTPNPISIGKISNDMVRAHVIDEEGNLYIYPVCRECNSRYKYTKPDIPFEVRMDELVPVPNQN